MFSAEESGINGPCSRPDHCGGATERCQDDRNPWVTDLGQGNPDLDRGNQRSHNGRPEADKEKYSGEASNDLWNDRRGIGCPSNLDDPGAHQQDRGEAALNEETNPRPPTGECRKQSLQDFLRYDPKEIATRSKRLKVRGGNPTFGGDPDQ